LERNRETMWKRSTHIRSEPPRTAKQAVPECMLAGGGAPRLRHVRDHMMYSEEHETFRSNLTLAKTA